MRPGPAQSIYSGNPSYLEGPDFREELDNSLDFVRKIVCEMFSSIHNLLLRKGCRRLFE